jgi:hypothetical protein
MTGDPELYQLLPSQRIEVLAAAIGRKLVEVERLFLLDLPTFLEDARFSATDFFALNSGPVQLHFSGSLTQVLDVWPSQLSIINPPDPLISSQDEKLYRLSEDVGASPELKSCLGRECQDVRIWTLKEDFESEEAKQVAVSYIFTGDRELFYCTYLHGDLDSDYLLPGADVPRRSVKSCFSFAHGRFIELK